MTRTFTNSVHVRLFLLQILSADGTQEVGKITKQWSGLAKEYFTDADNFGIQCEYGWFLTVSLSPIYICYFIHSPHGFGCEDEGHYAGCLLPHCE